MLINVLTGRIVKSLEAFKGSKPIYNKNGLLIVRGVCRDEKFKEYTSIKEYLKDKLEENKIEVVSNEEDVNLFVDKIDKKIGKGSDIYPDFFGFEMLKKSFEDMGCKCDYIIGKKGELFIGISLWYDKITKRPIFVEVICC